MDKKKIKNLPIEEKIKLLKERDKIYIDGYIDRALKDLKTNKTA